MTKTTGTFINSPWHLAVAVRISLGARLEITGFLLHWCIMHADNGSVVSVHGRPGAPLVHVICNASVQWALFLVKSNYPHKTELRASRLSTKKKSTDEPQHESVCVCVGRTFRVQGRSAALAIKSHFLCLQNVMDSGTGHFLPANLPTLMWGMEVRKTGIQRFNTNNKAPSEIMEPRFIWLDEECSGQLQRPW